MDNVHESKPGKDTSHNGGEDSIQHPVLTSANLATSSLSESRPSTANTVSLSSSTSSNSSLLNILPLGSATPPPSKPSASGGIQFSRSRSEGRLFEQSQKTRQHSSQQHEHDHQRHSQQQPQHHQYYLHSNRSIPTSSPSPSQPHAASTSSGYGSRVVNLLSLKSSQEISNTINKILKHRSGNVLGRNTILKTDHFRRALKTNLDFHLEGAPNFRGVDFNVYGVAQPTRSGLATLLTLLNAHPSTTTSPRHNFDIPKAADIITTTPTKVKIPLSGQISLPERNKYNTGSHGLPSAISTSPSMSMDAATTIKTSLSNSASIVNPSVIWFSTREEPLVYLNGKPYVLREEQSPKQNIKTYAGISTVRLEQMEVRLRDDIAKEMANNNGLLLVHDELDDGTIVPCWVSPQSLQTPKEVFQEFQQQGYRLIYSRLPISQEQRPEDRYLDEYIDVIRNTNPKSALVFNCGVGAGRS